MNRSKLLLLLPFSLICLQNLGTIINYNNVTDDTNSNHATCVIHKNGHARNVTQFTSSHLLSNADFFNKLKQKFANSNIDSTVQNKTNFNMNISYSGFNSFGIKVHHVKKSSGGKLQQPNLNIGLSLLSDMQVQVPEKSSKWVNYVVDSAPTMEPSQVSAPSITYSVNVSGSKENEKVIFVMSYALRNAKATDKKKDLQLGHFNVYNAGNNAKNKLSAAAIGVITSLLVALVIFVACCIGGGVSAYIKRASIKTFLARKGLLRAEALAASEKAALAEVRPVGVGNLLSEDDISFGANTPPLENSSRRLYDESATVVPPGNSTADGNVGHLGNKVPNVEGSINSDQLGVGDSPSKVDTVQTRPGFNLTDTITSEVSDPTYLEHFEFPEAQSLDLKPEDIPKHNNTMAGSRDFGRPIANPEEQMKENMWLQKLGDTSTTVDHSELSTASKRDLVREKQVNLNEVYKLHIDAEQSHVQLEGEMDRYVAQSQLDTDLAIQVLGQGKADSIAAIDANYAEQLDVLKTRNMALKQENEKLVARAEAQKPQSKKWSNYKIDYKQIDQEAKEASEMRDEAQKKISDTKQKIERINDIREEHSLVKRYYDESVDNASQLEKELDLEDKEAQRLDEDRSKARKNLSLQKTKLQTILDSLDLTAKELASTNEEIAKLNKMLDAQLK